MGAHSATPGSPSSPFYVLDTFLGIELVQSEDSFLPKEVSRSREGQETSAYGILEPKTGSRNIQLGLLAVNIYNIRQKGGADYRKASIRSLSDR